MEMQPAPRQLVRRRAERKIAGVAAGLADYVGIDPIWVRLLFVLTAVGGVGFLIYLTLWILMPASDEPSTGTRRGTRDLLSRFGGSTFGTVVIAIGVLIVATQVFDRRPGLFWGLALIALGMYLFRERDASGAAREAAEPRARVATDAPEPDPTMPFAPETQPVARSRRRPPRERSPLGVLTIGAVLVIVGLMWLVNVTTGVDIRLVQYLAAALAILGAGVGAGAWIGRARWLVLPALILLPMTVAASAITVPLKGGYGDRWLQPERYSSLDTEYRVATGGFYFYLAELPKPGPSDVAVIDVSVAIGHIDLALPPDIAVDVNSHVGIGTIDYDGRRHGYLDTTAGRRFGPAAGSAAVTFDLRTSIGYIRVYQVEREPKENG